MNKAMKIIIVAGLMIAVGVVIAVKQRGNTPIPEPAAAANSGSVAAAESTPDDSPHSPATTALPKLVDLGAGKCIPCKMMAPILENLKEEYAGKLDVVFVDVWENPDEATKYKIKLIPTQIFYGPSGNELFRHEGFFSKEDILAKWKELGVSLEASASSQPAFERFEPAKKDTRPKDQVCYMCDGTINPKTRVTVKTAKGDVGLCNLHCYFVMVSCLTEDTTDFEKKVTVTDVSTGKPIALSAATFLVGTDLQGRPVIAAYGDAETAKQDQQSSGGNLVAYEALIQNELSHRCGFCDRACYPQDAAEVIVEGKLRTWGCCSHCALGVAARSGKDIEVHEKDRFTGEPIVVKTFNGSVASIEPSTAVAWFGQRQKADGTWGSAGCFHQGFFSNAAHLKKWVEQNPYETGKQISIHQALADKMKLSPEQIQKACKIGECSPK